MCLNLGLSVRMGKKRVGRKDFLRSGPAGTEPEPEVASQPEPPRKADVVQGSADQDDLDASSRFLKEPEKQATQSASRIDSESVDVADGMETEAPTTPVGVEEKTRGQIVQRHKKVRLLMRACRLIFARLAAISIHASWVTRSERPVVCRS